MFSTVDHLLRPWSFVLFVFVFVIIFVNGLCVGTEGGVSLLVLSLSASASSAVSTCRLLIGRSSLQSLMDGAWFLPSSIKPPGCH